MRRSVSREHVRASMSIDRHRAVSRVVRRVDACRKKNVAGC